MEIWTTLNIENLWNIVIFQIPLNVYKKTIIGIEIFEKEIKSIQIFGKVIMSHNFSLYSSVIGMLYVYYIIRTKIIVKSLTFKGSDDISQKES